MSEDVTGSIHLNIATAKPIVSSQDVHQNMRFVKISRPPTKSCRSGSETESWQGESFAVFKALEEPFQQYAKIKSTFNWSKCQRLRD